MTAPAVPPEPTPGSPPAAPQPPASGQPAQAGLPSALPPAPGPAPDAPPPDPTAPPPAVPSAAPPTPAPPASPPVDPAFAHLDVETQGWLANRVPQGTSAPDTIAILAKTAREAHTKFGSLQGVPVEELVRVPGEGASPEIAAAFYKRIGVPETPEGYELGTEAVEDGKIDIRPFIAGSAHRHHVPVEAVKGIVADFNAYQTEIQTQMAAALTSESEADDEALSSEWGAAYADNHQINARTMAKLGIDPEFLQEMTYGKAGKAKMQRWLNRIGKGLGMHEIPDNDVLASGGRPFGMDKATALAQKKANFDDPDWRKRYIAKDPKTRAEAKRISEIISEGKPDRVQATGGTEA